MRRFLLIIIAFLLSISALSAYETEQKFAVTAHVKMLDNHDILEKYLPFLAGHEVHYKKLSVCSFS